MGGVILGKREVLLHGYPGKSHRVSPSLSLWLIIRNCGQAPPHEQNGINLRGYFLRLSRGKAYVAAIFKAIG